VWLGTVDIIHLLCFTLAHNQSSCS